MGGCQNYGPFLGPLNIRGRIIIGTQKGTIILTTTHIYIYGGGFYKEMESQMEKRIEHEMETTIQSWVYRVWASGLRA